MKYTKEKDRLAKHEQNMNAMKSADIKNGVQVEDINSYILDKYSEDEIFVLLENIKWYWGGVFEAVANNEPVVVEAKKRPMIVSKIKDR